MRKALFGAASVLMAGAAASATPVLQFDLNSFGIQVQDATNTNSAFGGTTHTGRILFSLGSPAGQLAGIFIQSVANGAFNNAGFTGFTMTAFTGQVTLNNGAVTGGSFGITLNNGDTYTTSIRPGSGNVQTSTLQGGFTIQGLTQGGGFNDGVFGNVNVGPWFNSQGSPPQLPGSFLEFNFAPNTSNPNIGAGFSDMDAFVDVVPLPPAAWGGMAMLGGLVAIRRLRRRA